ncbi:hypothetical protein AB1N83_008813 [Pleurotus pulmonarius]
MICFPFLCQRLWTVLDRQKQVITRRLRASDVTRNLKLAEFETGRALLRLASVVSTLAEYESVYHDFSIWQTTVKLELERLNLKAIGLRGRRRSGLRHAKTSFNVRARRNPYRGGLLLFVKR